MAQSDDVSPEVDRERLPKGQSRLIFRGDDVTVTVEGDEEAIEERWQEHLADLFDTTVEEMETAVEELPMPDPKDLEASPAEEFYED